MSSIKVGDIIKGQITGVAPYGVFVNLKDDYTGLIHISEVSDKFVKDLPNKFSVGDIINVKVLDVNHENAQVKLSIKKIDYSSLHDISMIPESGSGFGMLEVNLKRWTKDKFNEINMKK